MIARQVAMTHRMGKAMDVLAYLACIIPRTFALLGRRPSDATAPHSHFVLYRPRSVGSITSGGSVVVSQDSTDDFSPLVQAFVKAIAARVREELRGTVVRDDDGDDLMTDEDVMAMLNVSKQWLNDHTTRVEPILPHVMMGRERRYLRNSLMRWLAAREETRPRWERGTPAPPAA